MLSLPLGLSGMTEEIRGDVEGSATKGEHKDISNLSGERCQLARRTGRTDTIVVIVEICEIIKIVRMMMFRYLTMQSPLYSSHCQSMLTDASTRDT